MIGALLGGDTLVEFALYLLAFAVLISGAILFMAGFTSAQLPPNPTWWQRFKFAVYEFL